jgi:hypothetical protein
LSHRILELKVLNVTLNDCWTLKKLPSHSKEWMREQGAQLSQASFLFLERVNHFTMRPRFSRNERQIISEKFHI